MHLHTNNAGQLRSTDAPTWSHEPLLREPQGTRSLYDSLGMAGHTLNMRLKAQQANSANNFVVGNVAAVVPVVVVVVAEVGGANCKSNLGRQITLSTGY